MGTGGVLSSYCLDYLAPGTDRKKERKGKGVEERKEEIKTTGINWRDQERRESRYTRMEKGECVKGGKGTRQTEEERANSMLTE